MLRIDASGGSTRASPSTTSSSPRGVYLTWTGAIHLHLVDMGGLTYGSYGAGSTLAVIGLCTRRSGERGDMKLMG